MVLPSNTTHKKYKPSPQQKQTEQTKKYLQQQQHTKTQTISIMAKHSQLHLMSQQVNVRSMTKAEVAASQDSDRETTDTTRVVINSINNNNNNITDLENYHLTQSSILPIAVRAFDTEEDLENGERTMRPREPTRSQTVRDNVPIAIAVPMAAPLDECECEGEALKISTKSPASTLPPTKTTAPKPKSKSKPTSSPPISMWSLEESSSPVFRGAIAAMCGLSILLAWAVIAMLVSKGIRHHHPGV